MTKSDPNSNLGRYMREIQQFPLLEPDEELDLARRFLGADDPAAMHRLVTSHLRLVARIAVGYRGYGLPLGEVISEGNIGLLRAIRRFDPDKGYRLATYSMWWIRAAIQEYILHSWSLVKIGTTAAQKKLFFNLRKVKQQMSHLDSGDLSAEIIDRIATKLDVPDYEVVNMDRRLSSPDRSLNVPISVMGQGEWQDMLADEGSDQESVLAEQQHAGALRNLLQKGISTLNPREQAILTERRLRDTPTTLEDLSQRFGISRERVRQIEARAFEKLRLQMLATLPADQAPDTVYQ
ncbi:RNA polymerase sigma factor RpoH [Insolitispirillum peregrinum]|uniref:RNA polymerase sigma factor n=1 Tax=Insolitispirillum peregrinum TaxID=80876 RepID=A0A1N7IJ36_9PROT|nr:RNA polymerase, sigma 32 subunit, RpoH [Insolitispirillum peregrinum]